MSQTYSDFTALSNNIFKTLSSRVPIVSTTHVPDGLLPFGVTASPIETRNLTKEESDIQDKWDQLSKDVSLFLQQNNI